MAYTTTRRYGWMLVGAAGGAVSVAGAGEPVHATFTGAQSRVWHNALNWDIHQVPNNNGTTEYAVHLTTDCSFFFDCAKPQITVSPGLIALSELYVGENVDFRILDGIFRPGATEFGYGAEMTAAGGDVEFTKTEGDYRWMRVRSAAGGSVSGVFTEIPNCEYMLLEANDGGLTEFLQLRSVSGPDPEATFSARAVGGMVDVSALVDLPIASTWYAQHGGVIMAGMFGNSPIRFITVHADSVVSLPGVTDLDGASLRIHGDGVIQTPSIQSFDGGTVILEDGASYAMPITHFRTDEANGSQIRASASALSFPNLQSIEVADGVNLAMSVYIGSLELPQLTEIVGPEGRLELSFGQPGDLDIPLLTLVEPEALLHFSSGTHVVGPIEFREIDLLSAGGSALVYFTGPIDLRGTSIDIDNHSGIFPDEVISMDNADIELWMSSTFAPVVASCAITEPGAEWFVYDDSHLEMSALESLDINWADGPATFRVTARDGGRVTLGDLLIESAPDDRVFFEVDGEASALEIGAGAAITGGSYWKVANGGEIRVPGTVPIAAGASFELRGGAVHMPGLWTLDGAFVGIYAPTDLVLGAEDTDLHNTSVVTNVDWTLDATTWSWDRTGDREVFIANLNRLEAPGLREMSINPAPGAAPATIVLGADNGGVLDFSGVRTLAGPPPGSMHVLRVGTGNNGSFVDLSGLESATGEIKIDANRYNCVIDWGTDLRHDAAYDAPAGSSFRTWTQGTLLCRGSVFVTTATHGPHLGSGTLIMAAPGTATLEVDDLDGGFGGSFSSGIEQFVIGDEGSPTRVALVDENENGARGPNGEAEALYIGDDSFAEPFRVGPGASLVLNGLNVYVKSNQGVVHLNTLWPGNVRAFPYDDGMLYRVDPAACPADFTAPFGALDIFDVQEFLGLFSAHDPEADLNHDARWDFYDIQVFLLSFSAGCN